VRVFRLCHAMNTTDRFFVVFRYCEGRDAAASSRARNRHAESL
jgi:hypothetical protein